MLKKGLLFLQTAFASLSIPGARPVVQARIFLLVFVPAFFLGSFGYFYIRRSLTETTYSRKQAVAHLSAVALKERLDRIADVGAVLASSVRFRDSARIQEWDKAITVFKTIPVELPYIERISLADLAGTVKADYSVKPSPARTSLRLTQEGKESLQKGQAFVSSIYKRSKKSDFNMADMILPLRAAGGQPVGALALQVRVSSLVSLGKAKPSEERHFVFFSDQKGHFVDQKGKTAFFPKISVGKKRRLQDPPSIGLGVDGRGEKFLRIHNAIPEYGWAVVVHQPMALAFAHRNLVLGSLLALYAAVLFITIWFGAYILSFLKSLEKREEKYRLLVTNIPYVIWTSDHNGFPTYISSNLRTICGFSSEEVIEGGESFWFSRIHPDDLQNVKEAYASLLEMNMVGLEYRFHKKDGTWIWIEEKAVTAPLPFHKVHIERVLSDITERKQLAMALEASKSALQEYIDHMATLNAKVAPDGRLLLVNRTAEIASGVPREELYKTNFLEGPWWSFDSEVQNRVKEKFQKALNGEYVNYDERVCLANETIFINFSLTPVFGESGQIDYVLAEGRDISLLKKTQEALYSAQQIARVGSWKWDVENKRIRCSEGVCRILGWPYKDNEIDFKEFLFRIHLDDREQIEQILDKASDKDKSFSFDARLHNSFGELRWLHLKGELLIDSEGKPAYVTGTLLDITDLKRREEERLQLVKAQQERIRAEQAKQRAHFLAQSSLLLSSSLHYEATLERLARLLTVSIADWCVVYLADDQGDISCATAVHANEEKAGLTRQIQMRSGVSQHPVLDVVRRGKPLLLSKATEEDLARFSLDENQRQIRQALGFKSAMVIPLSIHGRPLGAIEFVSSKPEPSYSEEDLSLAEEVAHYASAAIENARLYSEALTAKEALAKSEKELSDFFNNAPIGLHWVGPEGTILKANQAELSLLGYTEEEYVGHNIAEFHVDQAAIREILERLRNHQDVSNHVTQMRRKDGSVKDVAINSNVLWEGDNFVHARCFTLDITDSKRAEEAMRMLADIVESTNDAVIGKTLDGLITSWNRGAELMYGYKAEEIIGRHISVLIPPEKDKELDEIFAILRRGQKAEQFETVRLKKDGTPIHVSLTISPIWDAKGRLTGASTIGRDVTQRKRYEEGLAKARDAALESVRLKSEFVANVSHEIRTPMNGIIGMTGLLLDTKLSTQQHDFVKTIRDSCDSLLTIINEILDFSKVEAGKMALEIQGFDLRSLVEGTAEFLAPRAHFKGLELIVIFAHNTPANLRGDPARIRQVLTNLVENAIKFTEKGDVLIRVSKQDETDTHATLLLSVSDTGIGIPTERHADLFQPFSQVDSSVSRKHGGTGLGLALCKRFVELMGGEIGVESQAGKGSTFWCLITFEKQLSKPEEPAQFKFPERTNVLVVSGNPHLRDAMAHQMKFWQIPVECAAACEDAIAILQQESVRGNLYRIVFVDQQMPDQAAFMLAKTIMTTPALNSIRVVFLTCVNQPVDSFKMRDAGISASLPKPVRQSVLLECLMEQTSGTEKSPGKETATPSPARKKPAHVLVVEDNRVNQKVILLQLEKLGYRADAVANGLEAVMAVGHIPYDLILMDCQMPEMDGYAATTILRQREGREKHTPIIAMTAYVMPGDREKCIAAGMDDYISKPVNTEQLKAVIAKWDGMQEAVLPPDESIKNPLNDPRFVSELSDLFIQESPSYLKRIKTAFKKRDKNALKMAAHTWLGSCCIVGTSRIRELCSQIETQAKWGKLEEVGPLVSALDNEFDLVKKVLRRKQGKVRYESPHRR